MASFTAPHSFSPLKKSPFVDRRVQIRSKFQDIPNRLSTVAIARSTALSSCGCAFAYASS